MFQRRIYFGNTKRALCGMAALTIRLHMASGQSSPEVTGDARVDKFLSQMTLAEKLTGSGANNFGGAVGQNEVLEKD